MNPEREMYIREIVRNTNENINAIRRELSNLEDIGLLTSTRKRNAKYYTVNKNMPIYNELTNIILKTEGVARVLQENLSEIGKIETAFIYGSFASKKTGINSDIDLFIIGILNEKQLIMFIKKLEKKLSREINYVLFEPREFRERIKNKDPFVSNVLKEPKIMLMGTLDEFR
jgi:predicted nucleotidyltransferase